MAKIPLRAYTRFIEDLIDRGMAAEAVEHCLYILKVFPKHFETYQLLAKSYLETQRYSEASDILQRILSVTPDDFMGQVGMSIVQEDDGNLDAAIFHMERAYEVQPANVAVQDELRRMYGRRDGVEPTKIRLSRGALVRMYLRSGLYRQAIAEIRAALVEDPRRLDLEIIEATIHNIQGERAEAVDIARRVVNKLPYCYGANQILAEALPSTTHAQEAQTHRDRLSALDPYNAFISSAAPRVLSVPDDSVMIEKLEIQLPVEQDFPETQKPEPHEASETDWLEQITTSGQDAPTVEQHLSDQTAAALSIADAADSVNLPENEVDLTQVVNAPFTRKSIDQETPIVIEKQGKIEDQEPDPEGEEEIADTIGELQESTTLSISDTSESTSDDHAALEGEFISTSESQEAGEAVAGEESSHLEEEVKAFAQEAVPCDSVDEVPDFSLENEIVAAELNQPPKFDEYPPALDEIEPAVAEVPDSVSNLMPETDEPLPDWLEELVLTPTDPVQDTSVTPALEDQTTLVSEPELLGISQPADESPSLTLEEPPLERTLDETDASSSEGDEMVAQTEPTLAGAAAPIPELITEKAVPETEQDEIFIEVDEHIEGGALEKSIFTPSQSADGTGITSLAGESDIGSEPLIEEGVKQEPHAQDIDFETAFAWLESLAAEQNQDNILEDQAAELTVPDQAGLLIEPSIEEAEAPTQPVRITPPAELIEEAEVGVESSADYLPDVELEAIVGKEAQEEATAARIAQEDISAETTETAPITVEENAAIAAAVAAPPIHEDEAAVGELSRTSLTQESESGVEVLTTSPLELEEVTAVDAGEPAQQPTQEDVPEPQSAPPSEAYSFEEGDIKPLAEALTSENEQEELLARSLTESRGLPPTASLVLPDWLRGEDAPPAAADESKPGTDALPGWLRGLEESNPEAATFSEQETTIGVPAKIDEPPPDAQARSRLVSPMQEEEPPAWLTELVQGFEQDQETVAESDEGLISSPVEQAKGASSFIAEDRAELLRKAQLFLRNQDLEQALQVYDSLTEQGEFIDESIHDLRAFLNDHPGEISAWRSLGDALARNNQLCDALDAYAQAQDKLI